MTTMQENAAVLTVYEAANELHYSVGTVRNMVRDGKLRRAPCDSNSKWLILKADVYAMTGRDMPFHEALSSAAERRDTVRELQRCVASLSVGLAEAQRLLAELEG